MGLLRPVWLRLASVTILCGMTLCLGADAPVTSWNDVQAWLTSLARQELAERQKKVAAISTPEQIRQRQEFIRRWMLQAVGGLPEKTPLNPTITGSVERGGYRIEKLVFESMPKFYVTANVYVPAGTGPFPAVLGVAGHSDAGKAEPAYQSVWISLAMRGILVLAYDPPGQGERLEYLNKVTNKSVVGPGVQEHIMAGLQSLLTGTTIARYLINDGVRAVDYLLTRRDVDPKRIGVAGNSGGGTQAAYLAVAEPRLSAAVTSCYITSWDALWTNPGPQDAEQVMPGFLHSGLDFGDFLLAFAPKPIQMMTATRDFFPIAGSRATFSEADKLFRIDDAPGRVGFFEYNDQHGWTLPRRQATYRWFAKWLLNTDDDDGREPIHQIEPVQTLNVTTTGQVGTSLLDGETVQSINGRIAERLYASRRALTASPDELRSLIVSRLGVVRPREELQGKEAPLAEGDQPLAVTVTEPKAPVRTVLWLGGPPPEYKDALSESSTRIIQVGLRGVLLQIPGGGYTPEYQLAMRALLVGKTLAGMQVSDALAAYAWAKKRYPSAQFLIGGGTSQARTIALLAAALEPRELRFIDDGPVPSYLDIVRLPIHRGLTGLIVPGVLYDFDLPDVRKIVTLN